MAGNSLVPYIRIYACVIGKNIFIFTFVFICLQYYETDAKITNEPNKSLWVTELTKNWFEICIINIKIINIPFLRSALFSAKDKSAQFSFRTK